MAGVSGHCMSHRWTCLLLAPRLFCNFHKAVTFRLHNADTAHRPHLPVLKTHILRYISHHCGAGPVCLLTHAQNPGLDNAGSIDGVKIQHLKIQDPMTGVVNAAPRR